MSAKSFKLTDPHETNFTEPLRARSFDSVIVGQEIPPRIYQATRGDLVHYAGLVGDPNPIHFSDYIAKKMGLLDVCAHGMLSMGVGASYITGWLGDPRAITDYTVRFTSPWYVPAEKPGIAEFKGKIKSLDPETRTGVIFLTAIQDSRKIFGKAVATVQFT